MKKNKLIILLLLIIGFSSCSDDYLTKYPIDKPASSTFLKSEVELEMAVVGAYQRLWAGHGGYSLPFEIMLDCTTDIAWERADASWQELGNGKVDPNNWVLGNMWTTMYEGIQRCNFIIQNVDRIEEIKDQKRVDQNVAQARFLRAYWYHHLIEMFGDVPLVTTLLDLDEAYVSKTSKATIYDFILTELEECSEILPPKYTAKNDIGKAAKGAALALKANVALYAGRWDVAADAAQRVMDLKVYELESSYENLYVKSKQDVSKEIILQISFLVGIRNHSFPGGVNTRMGSGYSSKVPNHALIDSYLCTDGLPIDQSPLYNPLKPFENRDPRMYETCVVPGMIFSGYQFESHKDSLLCWNYNVTPRKRVGNQDATNAYATFSGYCWKKYTNMEDPEYLHRSNTAFLLLRYGEVLLTYAEAKIEANSIDDSVYDAINAIRKRAGMPQIDKNAGLTQDDLRTIIRTERKIELALEGKRLYDIRRWKIAEDILPGNLLGRVPRGLLANAPKIDKNGNPSYDNVTNKADMRVLEIRLFDKGKNYLWPIPQIERNVNKNLTQNDGY
ncbi:RagB/SusD family nutrient uptake outer membrane protein [Paludibacter sp.]